MEVLRHLFNIGCKNLGLPQSSCLALTLLLQSKEELGTMVRWLLKQEKLRNKPSLTEETLIAEKIKDYYQSQKLPFYLLKTPKGEVEVYGFIDPETLDMYLDDAVINPEHPIHEYTHLWDKAMLKTNKDLWNQGVTLMKQLKLWKEIESSEQYGQKWKTMSTLPNFCTPIPLSDMKQDFFTFVDLSFPNFIYICTF